MLVASFPHKRSTHTLPATCVTATTGLQPIAGEEDETGVHPGVLTLDEAKFVTSPKGIEPFIARFRRSNPFLRHRLVAAGAPAAEIRFPTNGKAAAGTLDLIKSLYVL